MEVLAKLSLEKTSAKLKEPIGHTLVRKRLLSYIEVPQHIKEKDISNSIKMVLDSPRISSPSSRMWARKPSPTVINKKVFPSVPHKPPLPPPLPASVKPLSSQSSNVKPQKKPKLLPRKLASDSSPHKQIFDALEFLRKLARAYRGYVSQRPRFPSGSPTNSSTDYGSPFDKPPFRKVTSTNFVDSLTTIRKMRRGVTRKNPKKLSINLQPCTLVDNILEGEKKRRFTAPEDNESFAVIMERFAFEPLYH